MTGGSVEEFEGGVEVLDSSVWVKVQKLPKPNPHQGVESIQRLVTFVTETDSRRAASKAFCRLFYRPLFAGLAASIAHAGAAQYNAP